MITALQTPAAGAVLLDANNTTIKVYSDNGEGYFFRAEIYIDGILFDTQGWSRVDANTAVADLKKLYQAYFSPFFYPGRANGLVEQTHLRRQVNITIKEYALANPTDVVQSLALPSYYIMYTVKPEDFLHTTPIRFLGIESPVLVIPVKGTITVPFYVNSEISQNITVALATPSGTEVNAATANNILGKKVFLYTCSLEDASLGYNILWLNLTITMGENTETLTYRINRLPLNPSKQIAYQNNFGFYMYAYLDGGIEIENSLAPGYYSTVNGDEVFEVEEEAGYVINSGSFKENEKGVLAEIGRSIDTRLKNGTAWLKMITQNKKISIFTDRQNQYSAALQFKIRLGNDIENTGMIQNAVALPNIHITGIEITGHNFILSYVLNNGFSPANIIFQFRYPASVSWFGFSAGLANPITGTMSAGEYYVRLMEQGNPLNVSNQITVTIV